MLKSTVFLLKLAIPLQKPPRRGVLKKRYSEKMQQIYRITPVPKCDFNIVAKQVLGLMEFHVRYLSLFLLFSVISAF